MSRIRFAAWLTFACGASLASGCTANIEGQQPPREDVGSAGTSAAVGGSGAVGGSAAVDVGGPGRVVMHRLNTGEYNNTVRDLLGTTQRLSENMPPDDTAYGFDNVASALSMTDVNLGYYIEAAKKLAAEALSEGKRSRFVSCDVATGKETCVTTVVSSLLPKAWRRPVEAEEVSRLVALWTANKADGATDDEALARVLQAVLLAPEFLFRIEQNSGIAGVRPLNGYELASRLSYFLWSSMPDDALTAAAADGSLATAEGLAKQATRLVSDARSSVFGNNFGSQWLMLRSLENVHPDASEYPQWDDSLKVAMREETMRFFTDVAAGKRSLPELLTTRSGYVNDRLAQHYGMTAVGSATPIFVPMPADRGGLLTQAAMLTVQAHPLESAPVLRGKWILNQLLCKEMPPPPPDVPQEPAATAGQSRRERLAAHRAMPACKSCHDLMDPLGLALENYDGVGHYRTLDQGVPIDPSGTLVDGQSFAGPQELAAIIAKDPALPSCAAKHLFTYGLGRGPRSGNGYDLQAIQALTKSFTDGGQMLPKLVEAVVMSDAFRTREDEAAQ